jgi:hypothetical protein
MTLNITIAFTEQNNTYMFFNPQPILGSMQSDYDSFDRSVDRVLDAWDDRVATMIQADGVNTLTQAAEGAISTMETEGHALMSLIDNMEFYARR